METNNINAKSGAIYVVVPAPTAATSSMYALNLNVSSNIGADVKVGVGGHIEYSSTANQQNYTDIYLLITQKELLLEEFLYFYQLQLVYFCNILLQIFIGKLLSGNSFC